MADRGFTSKENRRHPTAGGGGYILGEKLRSGSAEAAAAMARQGRYQDVTANLRVKQVKISDTERFVICHNPSAADCDAAVRANLVDRLEAMIAGSDRLTPTKRAELRGVISTKPGLNRLLRITPAGLLRVRRRQGHRRHHWTGSSCSARPTRTCPPRTSRWATSSSSRSNAAGGT